MKKLCVLILALCIFLIPFSLCACTGNNAVMVEHLASKENYHTYRAMVCDIYYRDDDGRKLRDITADNFRDQDIILELQFDNWDDVKTFLGVDPHPALSPSDYPFQFTIAKENNHILFDNGFYDAATVNSPITIIASDLIYMDTNYFYIASIIYDETEYLPFEIGFENICKLISQSKSIL